MTGTHRGKTIAIPCKDALDAGHFISGGRWYPLDMQSAAEIRQLLTTNNKAHPGERVSLQMYLAMRQAGGPKTKRAPLVPSPF